MRVLDGVEHRLTLIIRHARLAAEPIGRLGERGLPAEIHRLCMDGVTEVTLQGQALVGRSRPNLLKVVFGHVPNQHVWHPTMLSFVIAPVKAWLSQLAVAPGGRGNP